MNNTFLHYDVIFCSLQDFSIKMGYSLDIAKAVDFLHQKDLVHQDIKPLNVLVSVGNMT